jgi:hypothetical protein
MKTRVTLFLLFLAAIGAGVFAFIYVKGQPSITPQKVNPTVARAPTVHPETEFQKKRADAADADVQVLLAAVNESTKAKATRPGSISISELSAGINAAGRLVAAGKYPEALDAYHKLYDIGWIGTSTLARNLVLQQLASFSKVYPPASDLMRNLRDSAMQQIRQGDADTKLAIDVTMLNKFLGDGTQTVELFQSFAPDDPRRNGVASVGIDSFVATQNYAAVVEAKPFGRMLDELDGGAKRSVKTNNAGIRQQVVNIALDNIEALVGAGRNDNAQLLINRLIEFDNTTTTRDLIKQHIERAKAHPSG